MKNYFYHEPHRKRGDGEPSSCPHIWHFFGYTYLALAPTGTSILPLHVPHSCPTLAITRASPLPPTYLDLASTPAPSLSLLVPYPCPPHTYHALTATCDLPLPTHVLCVCGPRIRKYNGIRWSRTLLSAYLNVPLIIIVEHADSLKKSNTYRGRAPRGAANVPRGPKGGAKPQGP